MVGFTIAVHTIQRLESVQASATTVASAWHAPFLTVLTWSVIESPLASFLRRWSKILFPILWRSAAIRIDDVYLLEVAAFIIIVMRWFWSFVVLRCFSLLLELAEV
jgi:hypothetical protein